jgi:hypothetical protein
MTLVANALETLDYVTGTAIPTNAGAAENTVLSTDVIQAYANPAEEQPGNEVIAPQTVRPVIIEANLNVTPGTTTTAIVIKCRQGIGTGGTQVGSSLTHTLAAGASGQIHCKFRDSSGVPFGPGGTAYTITITQTAGTAAGTVNTVDIEVKQ